MGLLGISKAGGEAASPACSPLRLDLHGTEFSFGPVAETGPCPLVRLGDEPARDRVAMHVPELLDAFGFGVDVEVVVAVLPEGPLPALDGDGEFEGL